MKKKDMKIVACLRLKILSLGKGSRSGNPDCRIGGDRIKMDGWVFKVWRVL